MKLLALVLLLIANRTVFKVTAADIYRFLLPCISFKTK